MNLDLLDESYPMVKSILHFEQVDQTGLTSLEKRSDRFHQLCQFWSSTYAPMFFGKACVSKNTSLDQNCLRAMINKTSAMYFFSILIMYANIAEIRKLANITIYGLRSANYFGFQIS